MFNDLPDRIVKGWEGVEIPDPFKQGRPEKPESSVGCSIRNGGTFLFRRSLVCMESSRQPRPGSEENKTQRSNKMFIKDSVVKLVPAPA